MGVGAGLSAGGLVLVFILWRLQEKSTVFKIFFLSSLAILMVCLGFSAAQIRAHMVYAPMLLKEKSPIGVTGTIETIEPLGDKDGSRVVLNQVELERFNADETPDKIRLKIRKDDGLVVGQRIEVLAGLNPASPPVAPGAFDFQRMMYFEGIGAVGFAYTQPKILDAQNAKESMLSSIRHKITERVIAYTTPPQQAVIVALMTGQRAAIRDADWDALRASGLAHLLAISGLHVGMVAGVLFFFSRLLLACSANLALNYPIKKWAAFIALVGALFYTLIVGATIPTQRALIMTGFVMVAIMFDRSPFSLRLVALAAMVVLIFSPESLLSVSFQMSFAAVVALIAFYEWLRPLWMGFHRKGGIIRKIVVYMVGVSLTSLVAGFATGLFALFHFQNYAVYGLLANMIAVPLMAFIVMPLIVLSYVLMPFGLSVMVMGVIEWGVGWILATAHWVAKMDGAVWLVPSWPQWLFIAMVLCVWVFIVWQGRLRLVMIPLFVLLTGLVFIYKQPDILVSSKVDLVSLRDENGSLWLSTGRKERYAAENWLRRNGQDEKDNRRKWPKEGVAEGFPLACDSYGCRGEVSGQKIAVAYSNKAWQEDCQWADIVISQKPVPYKECKAKHVIDFFDVWRNGAHAIWVTPEKVKIQTVEELRGKRLWTQTVANNANNKTK